MGWGRAWGKNWGSSGPLHEGITIASVVPDGAPVVPLAQGFRFSVLNPLTGLVSISVQDSVPADRREVEWLGLDFGEVDSFRTFLKARQGRLKPFWMPTYQDDLLLSTGTSSGEGTLLIKYCGYSVNLFPGSGARRHLWLMNPATGATMAVKVEVASDMVDGTEALSLVSVVPQTVTTKWRVMFLRLLRLDDDQVNIEWIGRGIARARFTVRELPLEMPL
jgi:hypothetical protein